MHRELVGRPLHQTLVLLWLAGLVQVALWLVSGHPLGSVAGTATLGAALTVLLAGRLHLAALLPGAVVLGLLAVLALAERLGRVSPNTWDVFMAFYGLLLWLAMVWILRLPLFGRIVRLLELRLSDGGTGDRRKAEVSVHWSSLALILLALFGGALSKASLAVSLPAAPLTTLTIGLVFLWLAGRRYKLHLHSYLFIALGAWGILSLYARLFDSKAALDPAEPLPGLLLALYGLGAWLLSRLLVRKANT
ncbi:MAG: hypothetical protein U1F76_13905 [Candidatus Competibacteraceae bacterium]